MKLRSLLTKRKTKKPRARKIFVSLEIKEAVCQKALEHGWKGSEIKQEADRLTGLNINIDTCTRWVRKFKRGLPLRNGSPGRPPAVSASRMKELQATINAKENDGDCVDNHELKRLYNYAHRQTLKDAKKNHWGAEVGRSTLYSFKKKLLMGQKGQQKTKRRKEAEESLQDTLSFACVVKTYFYIYIFFIECYV
jgi:transposase